MITRLGRREILLGGMSLAVLLASGSRARAEAALRGNFVQGTLIRGKTDPGAKVFLDGRALNLSKNGNFAFGFAYDRTGAATLRVTVPGGETESKTFDITKREYQIQKINGLPEGMVEPPASVMKRIESDNKLIGAARARDTDEEWFADDFAWPRREVGHEQPKGETPVASASPKSLRDSNATLMAPAASLKPKKPRR